jgi:hypothetical protein
VAADDQVVVHRQADGLAGLDQGPGQLPVRGGRGEVAAGVVVDQNEPGGLVFQGQFQDLAGIDHRLVYRAFLDDLLGNDFVLAVEEDHPELLVQEAPHGGAAVIHQVFQGLDRLAFEGLGLEGVFRAGLHQADEDGGILLDPHDLHEGLGSSVQDLGEGAEMFDHPLGQGLDVGKRDGEGQEEFQEFIVLQGPGAAVEEAGPQAGPVPVIMRFCRLVHHLHFLLLRQCRKCNREKLARKADTRVLLQG